MFIGMMKNSMIVIKVNLENNCLPDARGICLAKKCYRKMHQKIVILQNRTFTNAVHSTYKSEYKIKFSSNHIKFPVYSCNYSNTLNLAKKSK